MRHARRGTTCPVGTVHDECRVVDEVLWELGPPMLDSYCLARPFIETVGTGILAGFTCQLSGRWTSDQGTGTTFPRYHWQRLALRYGLRLTRDSLAAAGGASWNGAEVARWRCPDEDPASASCFPLPVNLLMNHHIVA